MNQICFEAGKITNNAMRDFLFSSFIALLFLSAELPNKLTVPFINVNMPHDAASSVLMLIDSFMFYRFMAAVNYERELKDRLLKECNGSIESVWLLSFPSIWNFTQFQTKVMRISSPLIVGAVAVILLALFSFVVPVWALLKAFILGYSRFSIGTILLACVVFILTFLGLFKTLRKEK